MSKERKTFTREDFLKAIKAMDEARIPCRKIFLYKWEAKIWEEAGCDMSNVIIISSWEETFNNENND